MRRGAEGRCAVNSIWTGTADGKYHCEVKQGDDPYQGILTVTEHETGHVLATEPASVSYGAIFGPDFEDVNRWTEASLKAIDLYESRTQ